MYGDVEGATNLNLSLKFSTFKLCISLFSVKLENNQEKKKKVCLISVPLIQPEYITCCKSHWKQFKAKETLFSPSRVIK